MYPRCGKTEEDSLHILVCEEPKSTSAWNVAMEELDQWLKDQLTDSNIREFIMQGVQSLQTGNIPTTRRVNLVTPCMIQNEMGWYAMFTGCAAEEWCDQQQYHYNAIPANDG
jgi:hypothetical protein